MREIFSACSKIFGHTRKLSVSDLIKFLSFLQVTEPDNFKGWADLRNRQIDTFPKFTYPLMMLLAQDLHFRFDLRQVDFYGVSHNGSFDGLVGHLQRREAEVGLASLFMRHDRMQVADFFSETCVLACAFIFRQPSRSAVSNVFLAPFSAGVWGASACVAASAALLLVALRRLRQHTRASTDLQLFTLLEAITFALGSLCQQGCKDSLFLNVSWRIAAARSPCTSQGSTGRRR